MLDRLVCAALLLTALGHAPVGAADLVLNTVSDRTVVAAVNGVPLRLEVRFDHEGSVNLNRDAAARAGLGRGTGKSLMRIGPVQIPGRHTQAVLNIAGQPVKAEISWYERDCTRSADGTISAALLPFDSVTIKRGAGARSGAPIAFQTRFHKNHGLYVPVQAGGKTIAVRFSMDDERSTAPAAAAALLVRHHGGALSSTRASEEIGFGVVRPVRQLRFERPVPVGALRLPTIMVRAADFRGDHRLPQSVSAQPEDAIVVTGVRKSQEALYRMTLGSDVLGGCSAIGFVRASRLMWAQCDASGK
jgi:hypothetical protein